MFRFYLPPTIKASLYWTRFNCIGLTTLEGGYIIYCNLFQGINKVLSFSLITSSNVFYLDVGRRAKEML